MAAETFPRERQGETSITTTHTLRVIPQAATEGIAPDLGPLVSVKQQARVMGYIESVNQSKIVTDISRGHRLAAEIQAGQIYINTYGAGGGVLPFGGFKKSGYGREKGYEALDAFTATKTVIVQLSTRLRWPLLIEALGWPHGRTTLRASGSHRRRGRRGTTVRWSAPT